MNIDIQAEINAGEALIQTLPAVKDFALIGSATYCADPHDVDFAVLIDPAENAVDYTTRMQQDGWGNCGEYDGVGGIWAAVRREHLNLMVTHCPTFFDRYKAAMEVCKALRLEHKEDRIAVCQIVRDGKKAEEVRTYGTHLSAVPLHPSLIDAFGLPQPALTVNAQLAQFRSAQVEAGIPDEDLMPSEPTAAVAWLIKSMPEWS